MTDTTLQRLETAATGGSAAAMTELGLLLLGRGAGAARQAEAVDWLHKAAAQDDAQACAQLAVLAGAGVYLAQDWAVALDGLQRAAELGWAPAQAELTLLAAGPGAAVVTTQPYAGTRWRKLRAGVDVCEWTTAPPRRALAEGPRLRCFEGFVGAAVCDWLIERARPRLARARTYDHHDGAGRLDPGRTNLEADFHIGQTDLLLCLLRARIASASGLPTQVMELTKVLRYGVGEHFAPHFDFIDPAQPGLRPEIEARGQRLATLLVYLNDDHAGGETEFPLLELRHRGRRGDALMFANVDLDGLPERRSLHAGLPPTRGEKWLLSQWIRDRVPATGAQ